MPNFYKVKKNPEKQMIQLVNKQIHKLIYIFLDPPSLRKQRFCRNLHIFGDILNIGVT